MRRDSLSSSADIARNADPSEYLFRRTGAATTPGRAGHGPRPLSPVLCGSF